MSRPSDVKLQILQATATANDGNVPANVLDENPQTRWSALSTAGGTHTLTLELCKSRIGRIEIDWFQGIPPHNARKANYDVTSDNGTIVFSGSTAHNAVLPVDIAETKKIDIIGKGNSLNRWNSIIEVRFFGTKLEDCTLPTCQPGQHRDPVTGQCVPDTDCPPGQHIDPVTGQCVPDRDIIEDGVKMKYPRVAGTNAIKPRFSSGYY